nr:hypothetical protein [Kibdelosporangium sp. MJ126-NF4]CEL15970.1 hypothetical protein [Kibdelosporangium sp. MJ126-NF4]CTQ93894.1 hypothetical protein [Kibdelosporangium sp. MJ126-NF4]
MRKTIRRGVLASVIAACTLGFGFSQASADTMPSVPELPLSNLVDLPSNLGSGLNVVPNTQTLPVLSGLPGLSGSEQRSDLPVAPPSVNGVGVAGGLPGKAPVLPGINVVPKIGGNNLGGVNPPSVEDLTSGKALTGDATQKLPLLSTTKLLPL